MSDELETQTIPVEPAKAPKTKAKKKAANPVKVTAKPSKNGKPVKKEGLSLIAAAAKVLKEKRGKPMSCAEMVDAVVNRKLWKKMAGEFPAATLSSSIRREIREKKKESRFKWVDKGQFVHV